MRHGRILIVSRNILLPSSAPPEWGKFSRSRKLGRKKMNEEGYDLDIITHFIQVFMIYSNAEIRFKVLKLLVSTLKEKKYPVLCDKKQ